MNRVIIAILTLWLCVSSKDLVRAADNAHKLYILFAMDTHADEIGRTVEKDCSNLTEVIGEIRNGREDKIEWAVLKGENLTPAAVLNYYKYSHFDAHSALLFIYSGHGGLSATSGNFFAMKYGNLVREDLREAMEGTGSVLQVILADSCSNIAGFDPPNRRVPAEWSVFKQLFFQSSGMVDILASEETTFSWGNSENGGMFTKSLTKLLCEPMSTFDRNNDSFVTWSEFFEQLRAQTNQVFVEARDRAVEDRRNGQKVDPSKPNIADFENQTPSYYYMNSTDRWTTFSELSSKALDRQRAAYMTALRDTSQRVARLPAVRDHELSRLKANLLNTMAGYFTNLKSQVRSSVTRYATHAQTIAAAQGSGAGVKRTREILQSAGELEASIQSTVDTLRSHARRQ